jgi:hypothetical protein
VAIAAPALADPVRQNYIWARATTGLITMDGVLNEPAWAAAESRVVKFDRGTAYQNSGNPGSGWKFESGIVPQDSVVATFKFLAQGNQLWMGVVVLDKSVGGSSDFNFFDGLLMAIKDHTSLGHPAPPAEYLYSWWYQDPNGPDPPGPAVPNPKAKGLPPTFGGRWAESPWGSTRTQEQIDAWNAVTVVNGGFSNSDTTNDVGYTIEMRFDVGVMGYNLTQASGDIVEWNVSVYDCDWFWPLQPNFSANRTWWQSPWGNVMWYDEVRIYCHPAVTTSSGPAPVIGAEVRIPNATAFTAPTIDGVLSEPVWAQSQGIKIEYGDDAVRAGYGNPLKWRAGQFQPSVNAGQASVQDPGDATVKWFFKGNFLYLGFDVNDISVTSIPVVDRWDGFLVSINDRAVRREMDHNLESRRLAFRVGGNGQVVKEDYTIELIDNQAGGQIALALKPNTTVDTTGNDFDEGYTAEFSIDLTKLGYPSGLGDGALWIGIDYFDGDCFTPFTLSYGTRTWWGREYENECCPASAYLDPTVPVAGIGDLDAAAGFALLGNFPNPFEETTAVRFSVATASRVTLEIFDLQGRLVSSRPLGTFQAGTRSAAIERGDLAAGVYLYRLRMADARSGVGLANLSGKMLLMR